MITTNGDPIATCSDCLQRGVIAAYEGMTVKSASMRLCVDCYDRAGDDNMVSDGNMTCDEFQSKWNGRHSDYCPGHDFTVTLSKAQFDALTAIVGAECKVANDRITSLLQSSGGTIATLQTLQSERAAVESIRESLWATLVK